MQFPPHFVYKKLLRPTNRSTDAAVILTTAWSHTQIYERAHTCAHTHICWCHFSHHRESQGHLSLFLQIKLLFEAKAHGLLICTAGNSIGKINCHLRLEKLWLFPMSWDEASVNSGMLMPRSVVLYDQTCHCGWLLLCSHFGGIIVLFSKGESSRLCRTYTGTP